MKPLLLGIAALVAIATGAEAADGCGRGMFITAGGACPPTATPPRHIKVAMVSRGTSAATALLWSADRSYGLSWGVVGTRVDILRRIPASQAVSSSTIPA